MVLFAASATIKSRGVHETDNATAQIVPANDLNFIIISFVGVRILSRNILAPVLIVS